jgi:di/tricarboxylate transporter
MGAFRFSSSTVWLVFGAFMFALGYEKTGLGHRIALVMVKVWGATRSRSATPQH